MKLFNMIFNWLISSGFLGVLATAVYQAYESNKRKKVADTADMLRQKALRDGQLLFRQPDANGQRVSDALTGILKTAQKPFYWHTFSDSTLGAIAKETVDTLLNNPSIVKSIENELEHEHSANQSYDVAVKQQATPPSSDVNIDQSIAAKQASKGGE